MSTAMNVDNSKNLPTVGKKSFSYLPSSTTQKPSHKFQLLTGVRKKEKSSPSLRISEPTQKTRNIEKDHIDTHTIQEKLENQSVISNEDLQIAMDNGKLILDNYKQSGLSISIHKNITESKTEITEMISWNKASRLTESAKKILSDLIDLENNTTLYRAIFSAKTTLAHGKSGNTSTTILDEIMSLSQKSGLAKNAKLRSDAQKISHKLEALLYSYENNLYR